jgi:hypothetical protein
MKTTHLLAITTLLVTVAGCSKSETPETMDKAAVGKVMEAVPAAETKSAEMLPNEIKADDTSGKNVEQDASGKKVIYWEDPMVEGRHFSKSGKSPFMDMQLAPRYAE